MLSRYGSKIRSVSVWWIMKRRRTLSMHVRCRWEVVNYINRGSFRLIDARNGSMFRCIVETCSTISCIGRVSPSFTSLGKLKLRPKLLLDDVTVWVSIGGATPHPPRKAFTSASILDYYDENHMIRIFPRLISSHLIFSVKPSCLPQQVIYRSHRP